MEVSAVFIMRPFWQVPSEYVRKAIGVAAAAGDGDDEAGDIMAATCGDDPIPMRRGVAMVASSAEAEAEAEAAAAVTMLVTLKDETLPPLPLLLLPLSSPRCCCCSSCSSTPNVT